MTVPKSKLNMDGMSECARGCVHGKVRSTQNVGLKFLLSEKPLVSVSVCMCVVMNEYECMECKEERRKEELHHTHALIHTTTEAS